MATNRLSAERHARVLARIAALAPGRERARAIEKIRTEEVLRARDEDGAQEVAVREVGGFQITMTDINMAGADTIRAMVEIRRDGKVIHKDRHYVVNPPLLAADAAGDIVLKGGKHTCDPLLALAQTVLASSGVR